MALGIAEGALQAFKAGANLILDTAAEIINIGFDNIFNIRKIWFDAKLGAVSGGFVTCILDVVFRKVSHKIKFEFDFNDFLGSLGRLAHQILTGEFEYAEKADIIDIEAMEMKTPPPKNLEFKPE